MTKNTEVKEKVIKKLTRNQVFFLIVLFMVLLFAFSVLVCLYAPEYLANLFMVVG